MTEDEADNVEEDEAADLVDFASGLDYDTYIDDLEVRQALCVIRERIDQEKAMQAAAEAMEEAETGQGDWQDDFCGNWNNEAASEVGSQRSNRDVATGALEDTKQDWDASTTASDAAKAMPTEARLAA